MDKLSVTSESIFSDPIRRHAWIKYQIQIQGRNLSDLARDANVDRRTLYQVFQRSYPRMEKIIADALGLTPQELFPERYRGNTKRKVSLDATAA